MSPVVPTLGPPRGGRPKLAPLLLALLAGSSCAGPLTQRAGEARQVYREAGFGREQLGQSGLSFVAPRVSFGQETLGQAMLQGLMETIGQELPEVVLVHPDLAASRINAAGLSHDYAEMMRAYDQTGILERDTLARIAQVIGVRFVAVPILVNFREESATRLSALGLRIGKTTSSNARLQLQIWDGPTGRIAWDGLSELTLAEEVVRERFVRFELIIALTWKQLLAQIPRSTTDAP
jgi:hypothetical protein